MIQPLKILSIASCLTFTILGCGYTVVRESPPTDPVFDIPDCSIKIEPLLLNLVRDFTDYIQARVPYNVALARFRDAHKANTDVIGRLHLSVQISLPDSEVTFLINVLSGEIVRSSNEQIELFLFPDDIRMLAKRPSITKVNLYRPPSGFTRDN